VNDCQARQALGQGLAPRRFAPTASLTPAGSHSVSLLQHPSFAAVGGQRYHFGHRDTGDW